jgi:hypothetical protein
MVKICKKFLVSVLFLTLSMPLSVLPKAAYAYDRQTENPSGAAMFVDGLVIRPLGVAATVLGSAVFIVTWPFSALGGNVGQAKQALIDEPVIMTFKRPLGQFN